MTDVEYLLMQDIREKKAAARGARARVCGSKTSYVSLPSDKLTKGQLKKRSGKVMTYNLSRWQTYEELKAMPKDLRRQYLESLRTTFNASRSRIMEELGIAQSTMWKLLHATDDMPMPRPRTPSSSQLAHWRRFVDGKEDIRGEPIGASAPDTEPEAEPPEKEKPQEVTPPAVSKPEKVKVHPDSVSVRVRCTPKELAAYLRDVLDENRQYDIDITCVYKAPPSKQAEP